VDLQHLVEDSDIQAVYLSRWRADHVAKTLWRVAKNRAHWHSMPIKPTHASSGGISASGGTASQGARYLPIRVEACFVLGVEEHELRLWATDYRMAYRQLGLEEQSAWEDYLLSSRMSSVFYLVKRWAMVRRSDNSPPELARAAMALTGQAVLVRSCKPEGADRRETVSG
jgi:hypothetical protein